MFKLKIYMGYAFVFATIAIAFIVSAWFFDDQIPDDIERPEVRANNSRELVGIELASDLSSSSIAADDIDEDQQSDSIVECEIPPLPNSTNLVETELRKDLISETLNIDPNQFGIDVEIYKLVYSTTENITSRITQLDQLLENNSDNEFLLKNLISSCLDLPEHSACGTDLTNRLQNISNEDGFSLSLLSAYEYTKGNLDSAHELLAQSAESRDYYDLYSDFVEIQRNVNAGNLPDSANLVREMMTVASKLRGRSLDTIVGMCREGSNTNQELANSCAAFGSLLENESSTSFGTSIGLSLERNAFTALGDDQSLELLEERQDEFNETFFSLDISKSMVLSQYDERLYSNWLYDFLNLGEKIAFQNLVAEAKRLSSDTSYNPCP